MNYEGCFHTSVQWMNMTHEKASVSGMKTLTQTTFQA